MLDATRAFPATSHGIFAHAQLKILTWRGDKLASDVLPIMGVVPGGPDYTASLATYYPLSKERTLQARMRAKGSVR